MNKVWIRQNKLLLGKILLLLGILLMVMSGLTVFGCVAMGAKPMGWSGVTISDGTLFLGSTEAKLVALNISSGNRLWETALETPEPAGGFGCAPSVTAASIYGTPVVAGDLVYVGSYNGKIYAVNSSSGLFKGKYLDENNPQPIVGGPVVSQGKVYIGCSDGKVYALHGDSLEKEWEFQTGDKIWSTPAIDGDTLFIGSFDKKLYAIDARDGSKRWEFETEGAIVSTPLIYKNTVYIGSFDRHLYAIDATDGSLKWKSSLVAEKWFWAQPVAYNDIIYAGCLDGKVYILDAESGRELVSAIDLGSPVCSSPVLVDSSIIIASEAGQVYTIDTRSNQESLLVDVKELAAEELTVRAPLYASNGVVYIHTQKKETLYALNAQTETILWSLSF